RYVRVFNTSGSSQVFHIYFDNLGYPNITFASPDPEYTIGQPASADNGFAVGAYVSRDIWIASNGESYWYGASFVLNGIAPYSSRGPRVNGGVQKPNITAPGSAIISLRDTDVYTTTGAYWIDNDGTLGSGSANYYVMTGTSMACPIAAGAAALLLDKEPTATPQLIYDAIQNGASTSGTGTVPNNTWGYGKLDVLAASELPLPVELSSFTAITIGKSVKLIWKTETEVNNYGFDVERASLLASPLRVWEKIGFVNGNGNSNSPKSYSYEDKNVTAGNYSYRLRQIDNDGQFEYSSVVEIDLGNPTEYSLEQNYPNPFNPSTTISFGLPEKGNVKIKLFNLLGQEVQTIIDETKEAGTHSINFNAQNLNSGVYLYKIESGSFVQTRKMTLVK
ncbi:MAG: S8/S53 family peptidase, partial [Ignavibacteria bacterium]|nr:S8/S53 family peptidase [Ignavibacteria bacterium]